MSRRHASSHGAHRLLFSQLAEFLCRRAGVDWAMMTAAFQAKETRPNQSEPSPYAGSAAEALAEILGARSLGETEMRGKKPNRARMPGDCRQCRTPFSRPPVRPRKSMKRAKKGGAGVRAPAHKTQRRRHDAARADAKSKHHCVQCTEAEHDACEHPGVKDPAGCRGCKPRYLHMECYNDHLASASEAKRRKIDWQPSF